MLLGLSDADRCPVACPLSLVGKYCFVFYQCKHHRMCCNAQLELCVQQGAQRGSGHTCAIDEMTLSIWNVLELKNKSGGRQTPDGVDVKLFAD